MPTYSTSSAGQSAGSAAGFVVLAGLAIGGYYLTVGVGIPMIAACREIVAALPLVTSGSVLANLLNDVLVGCGVGLAIGILRYVLRIRSRRVREAVETALSPEGVSAASIGFAFFLIHIIEGALGGLVVGLLGVVLPGNASGSFADLSLPAVKVLASSGYFNIVAGGGSGGGGGGPPPGLETLALPAWAALLLIAIVLSLAGSFLLWQFAMPVAVALASSGARWLGRSLGLGTVVVLTRVLPKRHQPKLVPEHWRGVSLRSTLWTGVLSTIVNTLLGAVWARSETPQLTHDGAVPLQRVRTFSGAGSDLGSSATAPRFTHAVLRGGKVIAATMEHGLTIWDADREGGDAYQPKDLERETFALASRADVAVGTGYRWKPEYKSFFGAYDLLAGRWLCEFDGVSGYVHDRPHTITPDGHWALVSVSWTELSVFDVESGHSVAHHSLHNHYDGLPVLSPDGSIVAVYIDKYMVFLGRDERELMRIPDCSSNIAFDPDGQRLAASIPGGGIGIWRVTDGQRLLRMSASRGQRESSLAFSPDGQHLASIGEDGALRLWDLATGRVVSAAAAEDARCTVDFGPDANTLLTSGAQVTLWHLGK